MSSYGDRTSCSRWTSLVELSSSPAAQSRHHLRIVQTTAEGTPYPYSGSRNAALWDVWYAVPYRNTYLLTYFKPSPTRRRIRECDKHRYSINSFSVHIVIISSISSMFIMRPPPSEMPHYAVPLSVCLFLTLKLEKNILRSPMTVLMLITEF